MAAKHPGPVPWAPRARWARWLVPAGVVAFLAGAGVAQLRAGGDSPAAAVAGVSTSTGRSPAPTVPGTSTAPGSGAATTPDTSTTPSTAPPGPVTLVFGGDIHFDGSLGDRLQRDPATVLSGLQPVLAEADLAVVNLETAVGDGGDRADKAFNFLAPPLAYSALMAGGVDVISMANNHALDYGQSGLRQTLLHASALQAPVIGIGADEAAALRPFETTVNGRRIAVIAATSVLDGNLMADWTATPGHAGVASAKRESQLLAAVAAARATADTVVVFLHWGTEATFCPNASQRDLAPKLVAAGADVIVGGHAHRVLGGGFLGGAYVHYGLGNLVFRTSSADARDTGLLRVRVDGRTVQSAEWLPGRIGSDFLPALLEGADRDAELATWNSRRECTGLTPLPTPA